MLEMKWNKEWKITYAIIVKLTKIHVSAMTKSFIHNLRKYSIILLYDLADILMVTYMVCYCGVHSKAIN